MPRLLPHIQSIRAFVSQAQRLGIAAICTVLLALPGVLPAAAQAAGDGTWIEICGTDGVELIRFDMAGGVPSDQPCPDCNDCLMCAVFAAGALPVLAAQLAGRADAAPADPGYAAEIPENPARFWPDNRGPPGARSDAYLPDPRAVTAVMSFERRAL
ncbi:hypothetical protein LCL97_16810 [Seohaeicola saemankumensis]|nr:DUF2946 family protein [Seohaeicola saemankumensis]MCA0872496.1 hypothetical protein [Seohaeicola saemankumensis]